MPVPNEHPTRPPMLAAAAFAAAALASPVHAATAWKTLDGKAPVVIAHRGASGYLPEHTIAAYEKAIALGADFIEPDLVMTKDGVLIDRHEPVLDGTTDVASKFGADRKVTRMLDGVSTTGYFADTFTLAEIKTLRAVQPRAGRDQQYNGQFTIPTLDEVVALAQARSAATGRTIGVVPELKHSTYMSGVAQANGFSATYFEDRLVATLHAAYGNRADAPVVIQSFETGNLRYLNARTNLSLVQLVDANDVRADGSLDLTAPYDRPYDWTAAGKGGSFADLVSPAGLADVATYADAIGPWKPYLVRTVDDGVDRNGDGVVDVQDRRVDGDTGVIGAAHAAGLKVYTWTFRDDSGLYGFSDPKAEMAYYMGLAVDGVFTDFTDTGVAARAMVSSVPEQSNWASLALGLAGCGAVARRRRRA